MQVIIIIPNSSFYLCFLDDIMAPQYLVRILNYEYFNFVTGKIILKEIERSPRYRIIKKEIERKVRVFEYLDYGEILRPFFSIEEIKKREHEVIAISCILYILEINFLAIIDDEQAIRFLKRNFPRIEHKITRTVGFMEECYRRKIFSKEETINILELIKKSKFRVKKAIIEDIIKRISEGF